jgi:hypothetical protein
MKINSKIIWKKFLVNSFSILLKIQGLKIKNKLKKEIHNNYKHLNRKKCLLDRQDTAKELKNERNKYIF